MTKIGIIFKLHDLEVYCMETFPTPFFTGPNADGFYWKDPQMPQGCGPFPSIASAVENYEIYSLQAIRAPGDLIRVDFKSKRRFKPKKV